MLFVSPVPVKMKVSSKIINFPVFNATKQSLNPNDSHGLHRFQILQYIQPILQTRISCICFKLFHSFKYYNCIGDTNKSSLNDAKQERSLKRQLTLDLGKGCSTSQKSQGPAAKKQKLHDPMHPKQREKYVCLQCMERYLQGKQEERSSNICRLDNFSTQQHKDRWHKLPDIEKYTFAPASSPSVV